MVNVMRIVAISDTHTKHKSIDPPEGDVLVHSGDFCLSGKQSEVVSFNKWLGKIENRYSKIIVVPGNHDIVLHTMLQRGNDPKSLFSNATLLIDESVEVDGIKFWGAPWTPTFFDWAFMLDRGEQIGSKWKLIPDDTDVLVTHGPPHGILDECPHIHFNSMINVGCEELMKAVNKIKPAAHIFGHIHEGAGSLVKDKTHFVNASVCNRMYLPINPIKIIDL